MSSSSQEQVNYSTASLADEMIVLPGLWIESSSLVVQQEGADLTLLDETVKIAVHGGETDPRQLLVNPSVDLMGVRMGVIALESGEHLLQLTCRTFASGPSHRLPRILALGRIDRTPVDAGLPNEGCSVKRSRGLEDSWNATRDMESAAPMFQCVRDVHWAPAMTLQHDGIDLEDFWQAIEVCYERSWTDGLPVVPPTEPLVARMLAAGPWAENDVLLFEPARNVSVTAYKAAVNAVMAGCRPAYLPVVIAALEAVCTDTFNIHGVMATTWGATPVIIVNGPIRRRLGMNMGIMALGYGSRPNATIGRAVKLVLRNVGGSRPGDIERSALGAIGKFTTCFAEWEERSPWEPLHVERGFQKDESVVTVFGLEAGSRQIADQTSRTARALVGSLGLGLEACWHPKQHGSGEVLLVISPEHADTIARDEWSKAQVRNRIQEITARPLRELLPDADSGEGMPLKAFGLKDPTPEQLEQRIPKFRSARNINIMVAGGEGGKFSAVFAGWVSGPMGSSSVSRKIEELP